MATKLETAKAKLAAKVKTQSTKQLVEAAFLLNLETNTEAILVSSFIANELETRLPEAAFLALMDQLEAELIAAE